MDNLIRTLGCGFVFRLIDISDIKNEKGEIKWKHT